MEDWPEEGGVLENVKVRQISQTWFVPKIFREMKYATIQRFQNVCERHAVPSPRACLVFDQLKSKYSETHRYYHDLAHVDAMLGLVTEIGISDDELELAIWFHDVVYDPESALNERASADYFLQAFDGFFGSEFLTRVERLIMATDPRIERTGASDEDLIIDIDLSVLGAEPEKYRAYSEAIRKEYSFVPESEYVVGRGKVMKRFLEQSIYATPHFIAREKQARINIRAELKELQKSLG